MNIAHQGKFMVLKIRSEDLNEIFRLAEEDRLIETCGILAGKKDKLEKVVEKIYHAKNSLASPYAYQIDPQEQVKIFEEIEFRGMEIVGFYHSHPFWDAFWSEADERGSKNWIGYSFLIVSLKTGKFMSYIRKEERVEVEEVIVI